MVQVARRRFRETGGDNIPVLVGDAAALPVASGSIDVVLASSVFQFLGYATDVLAHWGAVLRPGGRVVLSVPAGVSDGDVTQTLMVEYFGRLPPSTQARLAKGGGPRPLPDLARVADAAGLDDVEVADETFDAVVAGFDDWWQIQWRHGFRAFLREFDTATLTEMRQHAQMLLAARQQSDGSIRAVQHFTFVTGKR